MLFQCFLEVVYFFFFGENLTIVNNRFLLNFVIIQSLNDVNRFFFFVKFSLFSMNYSISSLFIEKLSNPLFSQAHFSSFSCMEFRNMRISKIFSNTFYLSNSKSSFKLSKSRFYQSLGSVIVNYADFSFSNLTFTSQTKSTTNNSIQVLDCTFVRCSSDTGGAIDATCSELECKSSLFYRCNSNSVSGAINAHIYSQSLIDSCCFEGCSASVRHNVIRTYGYENEQEKSSVNQTTIHQTQSDAPYIVSIENLQRAEIKYVNSTSNSIGKNKGGLAYFSKCYQIYFQYSSVYNVECICFVYSYSFDNPKSLPVDHCDIINNTFYYNPVLVKRDQVKQNYAAVIKFTRFLLNKIDKISVDEEAQIRLTITQSYFDCDSELFFNYTLTDKPVNVINTSYPLTPLVPIGSEACIHNFTPTKSNADNQNSSKGKTNIKSITIGVSVTVSIIVIVCVVVFLIFRLRRNSDEAKWFREETAQIDNPLT